MIGANSPSTGARKYDVSGSAELRCVQKAFHHCLHDQMATHLHTQKRSMTFRARSQPRVATAIGNIHVGEIRQRVQGRYARRKMLLRCLVPEKFRRRTLGRLQ